jgi:di/tricarboxylate transporter
MIYPVIIPTVTSLNISGAHTPRDAGIVVLCAVGIVVFVFCFAWLGSKVQEKITGEELGMVGGLIGLFTAFSLIGLLLVFI